MNMETTPVSPLVRQLREAMPIALEPLSVGRLKTGLVIVDEQHRFGVEQRASLIAKGDAPDVLLLTATPIPRSLALTRYGDLDVSIIREKPPGRGRIRTAARTSAQREKVFDFVHTECATGRQAFIVLPIIEESEKTDLRDATTMAEHLARALAADCVWIGEFVRGPADCVRTLAAYLDGQPANFEYALPGSASETVSLGKPCLCRSAARNGLIFFHASFASRRYSARPAFPRTSA